MGGSCSRFCPLVVVDEADSVLAGVARANTGATWEFPGQLSQTAHETLDSLPQGNIRCCSGLHCESGTAKQFELK